VDVGDPRKHGVHSGARIRADARGCDGCVREELAAVKQEAEELPREGTMAMKNARDLFVQTDSANQYA
jgi:hypothetical protein